MELKYKVHDFYNSIFDLYKCKENKNILICLNCKKHCCTVLKVPVSIYENIITIDGVCCSLYCLKKIIETDDPKYILTKNILIWIFYPIF